MVINTLKQVVELLKTLGYKVVLQKQSVSFLIGGTNTPFTAIITIDKTGKQLLVTCQVAKVGDFPENNLFDLFVACLDLNTRITPFAFGIITSSDNPSLDNEKIWPIVLIDSILIGDLSEEEFKVEIENLWIALSTGAEVIKVGLGQ